MNGGGLAVEYLTPDLAVQPAAAPVQDLAVRPPGVPEGALYRDMTGAQAVGVDHPLTAYELTTNQGDSAGRVYAEQGQAIRLVDKGGNVLFEGVGPEAARIAAGMAQSLSDQEGKSGKKATWNVQVDTSNPASWGVTPPTWSTSAADAKDNPHANIFKQLLPAALAIATGGLGAPLWAASLAAGAGSALTGGGVKGALLNGLGTFAGGSLLGAVGGGSGHLLGGIADDTLVQGVEVLGGAGAGAAAGSGAGALLGAGAGAAAGGALAAGTGGATPTQVQGVEVVAQQLARQGYGVEHLVAAGVPLAVATAAVTGAGGGGAPTQVEGVEVVGKPSTPLPTAEPITPPILTGLEPAPTQIEPRSLTDKALALVKAHPGLTIAAAMTLLGGGGGGGSGGKYNGNIPSDAGTRASLDPIFSAKLPPPTMGGRQPLAVNTDWATYGQRAEQPFLNNLAVTPAAARASSLDPHWGIQPNALVNQRLQGTTGYAGDFGGGGFQEWIVQQPEGVRAQARQALIAAGQPDRIHFATGGHVSGAGSGRSDSIDAKLSDGEYVFDAESTALLGDGSTRAGARKLDQLRVNLRKHKGRSLAKGKFSVAAKAPGSYMKGRG